MVLLNPFVDVWCTSMDTLHLTELLWYPRRVECS